ncbi:MAG: class I SAM-dependent methyltransferase [Verrucomicrobia bacterium]|nr:class I SAM-dependent methyltransferase [Verrucomicrobiota bacterium]
MNPVAKPLTPPAPSVVAPSRRSGLDSQPAESLFERFAWIYIFCREKVFRDDTHRIVRKLWPQGQPPPRTEILELGCGPGFYSRTLAARFPRANVTGIDSSKRQLEYARDKARQCRVPNCRFERGNVLDLAQPADAFNAVIASRLFTVLPRRERGVAEIFRVLSPGGKCFIAEPRFAMSASIPLMVMRLLARLSGYWGEYREPTNATVLSRDQFRALVKTQPWAQVDLWRAGRYQYAVCQKG